MAVVVVWRGTRPAGNYTPRVPYTRLYLHILFVFIEVATTTKGSRKGREREHTLQARGNMCVKLSYARQHTLKTMAESKIRKTVYFLMNGQNNKHLQKKKLSRIFVSKTPDTKACLNRWSGNDKTLLNFFTFKRNVEIF